MQQQQLQKQPRTKQRGDTVPKREKRIAEPQQEKERITKRHATTLQQQRKPQINQDYIVKVFMSFHPHPKNIHQLWELTSGYTRYFYSPSFHKITTAWVTHFLKKLQYEPLLPTHQAKTAAPKSVKTELIFKRFLHWLTMISKALRWTDLQSKFARSAIHTLWTQQQVLDPFFLAKCQAIVFKELEMGQFNLVSVMQRLGEMQQLDSLENQVTENFFSQTVYLWILRRYASDIRRMVKARNILYAKYKSQVFPNSPQAFTSSICNTMVQYCIVHNTQPFPSWIYSFPNHVLLQNSLKELFLAEYFETALNQPTPPHFATFLSLLVQEATRFAISCFKQPHQYQTTDDSSSSSLLVAIEVKYRETPQFRNMFSLLREYYSNDLTDAWNTIWSTVVKHIPKFDVLTCDTLCFLEYWYTFFNHPFWCQTSRGPHKYCCKEFETLINHTPNDASLYQNYAKNFFHFTNTLLLSKPAQNALEFHRSIVYSCLFHKDLYHKTFQTCLAEHLLQYVYDRIFSSNNTKQSEVKKENSLETKMAFIQSLVDGNSSFIHSCCQMIRDVIQWVHYSNEKETLFLKQQEGWQLDCNTLNNHWIDSHPFVRAHVNHALTRTRTILKHNHPIKIAWIPTAGRALINMYCEHKKEYFMFDVSTISMVLLLQFETQSMLTLNEILNRTHLPLKTIYKDLFTLLQTKFCTVHPSIISKNRTRKNLFTMDVSGGSWDKIQFRVCAKVPQLQQQTILLLHNVELKEKEHNNFGVTDALRLDTTIVRIMKAEKKLHIKKLIEHVHSKSNHSFQDLDIRRRIDVAIDLEYIRRDPNNRTLLIFIPA